MIRQLRLLNFKCFEEQIFQFRPLTLLTGLNGTGKSSLIQALLLVRQSYLQGLLKDNGLALNGDLVRIGTGKDALFEGAKLVEGAKKEEIGFDLEDMGREMARWRFEYSETSGLLGISQSSVNPRIFETNLFGEHFQYLQAERVGPRLFFDVHPLFKEHTPLGSRGEYTADFLFRVGDKPVMQEKLLHPASASSNLRDQVAAWMGEVSPGVRINLTPNMGTDTVSLRYSFAFVSGKQVSNEFRATNVGFGITYTLPILVAILSSAPGALILIENPEAHLHPKGQSTMGELMAHAASCGIQIVVETHSDHVLNGIRVAVHDAKLSPDDVQLHFFRRREEDGLVEVVSPNVDRDGRIDKWPDGFFDEWDKNLEALLEPRKE